jgi:hypothetical protein
VRAVRLWVLRALVRARRVPPVVVLRVLRA